MKLQLFSDLHLELYRGGGRGFLRGLDPSDVDVLVVAGDLTEVRMPIHSVALEMLCARFPDVVYVAGNHEFYGWDPMRVEERRALMSGKLANEKRDDGAPPERTTPASAHTGTVIPC